MRKPIQLLLILFIISSCDDNESPPSFDIATIEGYRPIYAENNGEAIKMMEAQPISLAGKIYVYGDLLLVNEVGVGIHVYDNKDKLNPVKKYFLNIPGNRDVAIKNRILYADSFTSLLAINVQADSAFVIKEIENVTASVDDFPPRRRVYFECIDESKGKLLGWELTTIENPECYRQ